MKNTRLSHLIPGVALGAAVLFLAGGCTVVGSGTYDRLTEGADVCRTDLEQCLKERSALEEENGRLRSELTQWKSETVQEESGGYQMDQERIKTVYSEDKRTRWYYDSSLHYAFAGFYLYIQREGDDAPRLFLKVQHGSETPFIEKVAFKTRNDVFMLKPEEGEMIRQQTKDGVWERFEVEVGSYEERMLRTVAGEERAYIEYFGAAGRDLRPITSGEKEMTGRMLEAFYALGGVTQP